MRKTDAFRRAAALLAALSITVSLAAPAFAGTYYIDKGNITVIKNSDGTQTIKHGDKEETEKEGEEIIITTSNEATGRRMLTSRKMPTSKRTQISRKAPTSRPSPCRQPRPRRPLLRTFGTTPLR